MPFLVYKITNTINQKLYFGITKVSLSIRWTQHKHHAGRTKKKMHLYVAMKKYGFENFNIELVKSCETEQEMYNLEIELIKKHQSNNRLFGYNNSTGGEVSVMGMKHSKETREKISKMQRGRKGPPCSEEKKMKLRAKGIGRDMSKAIAAARMANAGKPKYNFMKPVILNNSVLYPSLTEAALKNGISVGSITQNLKGRSKTTKAGIWKYAIKTDAVCQK